MFEAEDCCAVVGIVSCWRMKICGGFGTLHCRGGMKVLRFRIHGKNCKLPSNTLIAFQ